jgi:hypothetical protein
MTETELAEALDRWGADLAAWPANEAATARALFAQSAEARERHATALAIARLLDAALPAIPIDVPRLRANVLARLDDELPWLARSVAWLIGNAWRAAAVALVPLVLGFSMGMAIPDPDEPDAAMVDAVSLLALQESTYQEYHDAQ